MIEEKVFWGDPDGYCVRVHYRHPCRPDTPYIETPYTLWGDPDDIRECGQALIDAADYVEQLEGEGFDGPGSSTN